ncbi:MAG: dihydropteroate synthase-like protein [Candidatus Hydrothermarchaeaceae archaeon]
MKVLLVTGRLAGERVRNIADKHGCRVYVAPVNVASLITPRQIIVGLKNARGIDLILVPGLMRGDVKDIEYNLDIPTFRGPKDVADLDYVLENLGKLELSKTIPACEILSTELREKALDKIREVDTSAYRDDLIKRPGNILIGELGVGWDFPQRIVAEIVGVENLSMRELAEQGRYLVSSGADIIDIGMTDADPGRVEEAIDDLKPLGVSISLDTMESENIERALECGVSMVMSFDGELIEAFRDVKTPSVIIPGRDELPPSPSERVGMLEENMELAKKRGFAKLIPDPILMPPNTGLLDSLAAYREFSMRHPHEYPVLMGAGNVTELLDADSVGINTLLCSLASECNASLIFTVEASDKTRGSVSELNVATKMMYLSRIRGSAPKDLGLDLLKLKEKRLKRPTLDEVSKGKQIIAEPSKGYKQDIMGYFRIFVEPERIRCVHYHKGGAGASIVGRNAREITDTLLSMDLVSALEHALYLGRELQKAEFALEYGKSYVQG